MAQTHEDSRAFDLVVFVCCLEPDLAFAFCFFLLDSRRDRAKLFIGSCITYFSTSFNSVSHISSNEVAVNFASSA